MIFIPDRPQSSKALKFEASIRRLISNAMHKAMPELYARAQISHLQVSKCHRYVDLYMTCNDAVLIGELQRRSWQLKKELSGAKLRIMPQLRFHIDRQLQESIRISELLEKVD
jgi:ribosome-binding factor A